MQLPMIFSCRAEGKRRFCPLGRQKSRGAGGGDLLRSDNGTQVLDVDSPRLGLEGIEIVTGLDIAASIIDHIE